MHVQKLVGALELLIGLGLLSLIAAYSFLMLMDGVRGFTLADLQDLKQTRLRIEELTNSSIGDAEFYLAAAVRTKVVETQFNSRLATAAILAVLGVVMVLHGTLALVPRAK